MGAGETDPLVERYESGMSVEEAGRQCGIAPSTARQRLVAAGVTFRQREHPLKQVDIPQLVELYESGMTVEEAGRQCGIAPSTARQRLVAAGVTVRRRGHPLKQVDIPRLVELYESGMTVEEAGRQCGIARNTARRRLVAAGVTVRRRGHPLKQVDIPQLVELYESGMTVEEAGRQCGIAPSTARRRLVAAGVTFRQREHPLKQVDIPQLVELYESGMTLEEASRQCGIARSTARQRLVAAGVTFRRRGHPLKQVDIPQLVELYESGMTLEEAGRQCGIAPRTARRRLVAAGMGLIPPARPLPPTVAAFLYRRRYTNLQISQLTGLSERIVAEEKKKELARLDSLGVDIEKVGATYRIVASISVTAEVLHLSRNSVLAGLRAADAEIIDAPDPEADPIRLPEQTWWQRQDQMILARATQRQSAAEIASALRVPIATVTHVMRVYSHRDRTTAEILRRRECGESAGVIAIRMGLRLNRVNDVLARFIRRPRQLTTIATQQKEPRAGLHP
ncbi:response regulator of citrate/malate metabolism [Streptomyces sp. TE3672]